MKFEWKVIDIKSYGITQRAKVFGGWLVRTIDSNFENFAITFMPDIDHEWDIRINE
jgi:hypothetical protein